MFSVLREEQAVAVKGLRISSLGQEPQATVSVRKKDKCLVSNWIWLELGFGLSSLCRLRVGDGPFCGYLQVELGQQAPRKARPGGATHPSFTQKEAKALGGLGSRLVSWVGWGLD